jgi:hypothetical protein
MVCEAGKAAKEKEGTTVILRVSGLGSFNPKLSAIVREVVKVPNVENTMLPGVAELLVAGLPSGNTHEYEVIVPPESVPVPAKYTG